MELTKTQYIRATRVLPFGLLHIVLLALAVLMPSSVSAQTTTAGRDFWVGFLFNGHAAYNSTSSPHFSQANNTLSLVATSEQNCSVTATCGSWSQTVSITAGTSATITLPDFIKTYTQPRYTRAGQPSGIHVTSTADISLYALNYISASFDIATVLPTRSLGKRYVLQDFLYTPGSSPHTYDGAEFCVVGTRNGTSVTVTFTSTKMDAYRTDNTAYSNSTWPKTYANNSTYTFTIDSGYVHQIMSPKENTFTGTIITSDKPVAVFQGRKITNIPTNSYGAPDHLYEQSIPTENWGQDFIVVPDARTGGSYDYIQVTSLDYDCQVYINGSLAGNTSSQRTYFSNTHAGDGRSPFRVTTSKPASVCLYMASYAWRGSLGDPSSVIIPPVEQGTSNVTFNAHASPGSTQHYVNIVVPTAAVSGMRLDGANVSSQFSTLAGTPYSYSRLSITAGDHTLSNNQGRFNAWSYGMGSMESYAYVAAMSLLNLQYELFVDGDNTYTWGDTVSVCQNSSHHFKIETDGDITTRWYVDSMPQASTDTAFDATFPTTGYHIVKALQRGDCTAPNFCDTLHLVVHVRPTSANSLSRNIYVDEFPYTLNGTTYDTPGTYIQHLTNAAGCDSTLTITLTARLHSHNDTVAIGTGVPIAIFPTLNDTVNCDNPTITIITNGQNGFASIGSGGNEGDMDNPGELDSPAPPSPGQNQGIALPTKDGEAAKDGGITNPLLGYVSTPPYVGLDSVQIAIDCGDGNTDTSWVFIVIHTDTSATACDDFTWYGDVLTASGNYYHVLESSTGEDSLIHLSLTINHSSDSTITAMVFADQMPLTMGGGDNLHRIWILPTELD